MNIFILDTDIQKCAQSHVDKHVVKMVVETAQLLSTAHHINGINSIAKEFLYKKTHENHPCSIWTRRSRSNYKWLCELGMALCNEYTHRYGKVHATESKIRVLSNHYPLRFFEEKITDFALAMPDYCKVKGREGQEYAVNSYRNYYINEKQHIASWKNREQPTWFINI